MAMSVSGRPWLRKGRVERYPFEVRVRAGLEEPAGRGPTCTYDDAMGKVTSLTRLAGTPE